MQEDESSRGQVLLRIKRKRTDPPLDSVWVAPQDNDAAIRPSKRQVVDLATNFGALSTADTPPDASAAFRPQPLHFKRVQTTDFSLNNMGASVRTDTTAGPGPASSAAVVACNGEVQERPYQVMFAETEPGPARAPPQAAPKAPQFLEVRRQRAKAASKPGRAPPGAQAADSMDVAGDAPGIRDYEVIDLEPVQHWGAKPGGAAQPPYPLRPPPAPAGQQEPGAMTLNGEVLKRRPARVLNPIEREMDEAVVRGFQTGDMDPILQALRIGAPVNYRRTQADKTTALMAAAYRGDAKMVAHLLALGADPSYVDANENSALNLAENGGHREAYLLLRDALERQGSGDREDGDFVYDVYQFDPRGAPGTGGGGAMEQDPVIPVIPIAGISADQLQHSYTELADLQFAADPEWEELGDAAEEDEDDPDHEDYRYNDYPEDEDTDEEQGLARAAAGWVAEDRDSSDDEGPWRPEGQQAFQRGLLKQPGGEGAVDVMPALSGAQLDALRWARQHGTANEDSSDDGMQKWAHYGGDGPPDEAHYGSDQGDSGFEEEHGNEDEDMYERGV